LWSRRRASIDSQLVAEPAAAIMAVARIARRAGHVHRAAFLLCL
jgi:hypothetical protein